MKKSFLGLYIAAATVCLLFIIFLASGLREKVFAPEEELLTTKIITPQEANSFQDSAAERQAARNEALSTKTPMGSGEIVIAVLNRESEEGLTAEQFVVYQIAGEIAGSVYITCIGFDEQSSMYKRLWNAPTAATRPETLSIFTQDIIGDRNYCVIVNGMNSRNEQTMSIFMPDPELPKEEPYKKIAELQIDGSIIIQETGRSLAYQQGIANGQSFTIAAYGSDSSSTNILDQIETIYAYNPQDRQYERESVSKIPGSQIEQRRLREILSGDPKVFENFIHDLWYYVSPQGTIDTRQYLYFNPEGREIIFFGDETQQVFTWQNSTSTRYGLNIRSRNISISTIELESLDSIRLRVVEDVRLVITMRSSSWDGSYRRAAAATEGGSKPFLKKAAAALYDSPWGRLQFFDTGEYTISSANTTASGGEPAARGHYIFFTVGGDELLEIRPTETAASALANGGELTAKENRMIYKVENAAASNARELTLSRVQLGTGGIQDMLELPITLTAVE